MQWQTLGRIPHTWTRNTPALLKIFWASVVGKQCTHLLPWYIHLLKVAAYVGNWSRGFEASLSISLSVLRTSVSAPNMSMSSFCMLFKTMVQGVKFPIFFRGLFIHVIEPQQEVINHVNVVALRASRTASSKRWATHHGDANVMMWFLYHCGRDFSD